MDAGSSQVPPSPGRRLLVRIIKHEPLVAIVLLDSTSL